MIRPVITMDQLIFDAQNDDSSAGISQIGESVIMMSQEQGES